MIGRSSRVDRVREDSILEAVREYSHNEAEVYMSLSLYERRLYRNCVRGKSITSFNSPSAWKGRREARGEMSFTEIGKRLGLPTMEVVRLHDSAMAKIAQALMEQR